MFFSSTHVYEGTVQNGKIETGTPRRRTKELGLRSIIKDQATARASKDEDGFILDTPRWIAYSSVQDIISMPGGLFIFVRALSISRDGYTMNMKLYMMGP